MGLAYPSKKAKWNYRPAGTTKSRSRCPLILPIRTASRMPVRITVWYLASRCLGENRRSCGPRFGGRNLATRPRAKNEPPSREERQEIAKGVKATEKEHRRKG